MCKLRAAHAELTRRARRDAELAAHMPAIAARLQVIAADAAADAVIPPRGRARSHAAWQTDPDIDWTGIDGGDAT